MTDDDKALDKIIRASMPLDFERKETLSDDKALVERLRWSDGWFFENPFEDGTKQEHIAFEKAVDAASLIASEVLGQTE